MKWYSLRVISGKEKAAKENIMFDAEEHNLDEFISEIFVPFEKVIEMKNNKKKIKEKLFWEPKESFNTGIIKTVRWYVDNQEWWSKIQNNVYKQERLGKVV